MDPTATYPRIAFADYLRAEADRAREVACAPGIGDETRRAILHYAIACYRIAGMEGHARRCAAEADLA